MCWVYERLVSGLINRKELNDPTLTNETLKSVYAADKKQHGLLASEEIVALRQKYGLSQRAFAGVSCLFSSHINPASLSQRHPSKFFSLYAS